ncbi:hypothetical protein CGRA01v4_09586 [Colletotrichum graminicola]|nr:hypothetical protein CGRA01v4_09586 [Colletotrichum graminicola]
MQTAAVPNTLILGSSRSGAATASRHTVTNLRQKTPSLPSPLVALHRYVMRGNTAMQLQPDLLHGGARVCRPSRAFLLFK